MVENSAQTRFTSCELSIGSVTPDDCFTHETLCRVKSVSLAYIYIYIYNFCVEVFEKTISRTKMIDHSLERYYNGVCYRLYKNIVRGYCCARRALET